MKVVEIEMCLLYSKTSKKQSVFMGTETHDTATIWALGKAKESTLGDAL